MGDRLVASTVLVTAALVGPGSLPAATAPVATMARHSGDSRMGMALAMAAGLLALSPRHRPFRRPTLP